MPQDLYKYFRIEARELSEELGKVVLELEKEPAAPQLVARLLRLAHTLKGAARVVKHREIAERAHSIETGLAAYRDASTPVTRAQIEQLLRDIDEIDVATRVLAQPTAPASASAAEGPSSPRRSAPEAPIATLRADVEEVDALLAGLSETSVQVDSLRQCLSAVERARRLSHQLDEYWAGQSKLNVPLKLRSAAGELSRVCDALERNLSQGVDQIDRELRQVRESAERLRLLPARLMFHALERTARDAARDLGKQVAFSARGGEVRLEADLLNQVQHALVQAVRNALAHGIESPAERAATQKSAQGSVCIEVERKGGRVVFRCVDDGRGVALEAVRRAAVQKGVLSAQGPRLSEQATLDLLLEARISTATSVSEIAGRGVGLDLVRDVAQRLGGDVQLASQPGAGMTLTLSVPVSLSALDALIVEASGHSAAIPLESVRSTLRVVPGELHSSATGASLLFEGNVIPFTPLTHALRLPTAPTARPRNWSAVVVASQGALAAVGVDRLRGTENVVVRPLPALALAERVVAGATLDAGGNPRLVLDPEGLVALSMHGNSAPQLTPLAAPPVLVIDDSLTTRMLEQSILESAGYDVDLASSAEEGLEKARRKAYRLFLVDVEMPGMDGFGFVETIRADPTLSHVPAVLVTSRAALEDRRRGESVGANAYIVKSEFEQGELLERIRGLVSAS